MGKLNTLEIIKNTQNKINPIYEMRSRDIVEISNYSDCETMAIINAFIFGYAQGVKAQKKDCAYSK